MLLYRTRTLPRLREQSGTGGTGAPASDTQEGPTQPRCPCPWGREDAAYGGEPAHHSACPAKFPVKVNPQCYFLVPVNSQPKAFPPGNKQGCRPCEPARGAACAEACPRTASARRPTGSGGSPPGIGEFSSAWWAAEREDERDEGSGFAQRKEWAREKKQQGLPRELSAKESICQRRRRGFDPCCGRSNTARAPKLWGLCSSPGAATTAARVPASHRRRSHLKASARHSQGPPHTPQLEKSPQSNQHPSSAENS